ncbi:TonB-dependent siderophore receptor [Parafrankia sp. BMG5.11]|uniref:TonB-dependent receptor plug domain-containing protein n=1 Tax=Parafrankia sp. BMG5.11 TaxID=222540 RepID=UPI0010389193|nr:TonB-dependent receptor plug domain-containing protein [Parafrankia sp. BMG5.11]TCJ39803.1 TonB-dependent receptor [Parafrankia sp. BMG5.11]
MKLTVAATLLCSAAFVSPAAAQDVETGDAAPPQSTEVASPTEAPAGRQVYTPADFTRYAPKTAADMIQQIPGFNIRESEQLRGLGQATGNVLFNGKRSSTKSESLFNLLTRIPATNVERIEIVDGATLDIPGLSGQVANIVYQSNALSGQFAWTGQVRAHYADPLFTRGSVSVSGRSGALEYEAGIDNSDAGRSAAGGPTRILDRGNVLTELRSDTWTSNYDAPKISGKVTWNGAGGSVAHANAHYQRTYSRYDERGLRQLPGLPDRVRTLIERNDTWNYELGGDYEFGLGPGKLKLIGLRSYSHEPYLQQTLTEFDDGTAAVGDRFTQTGNLAETVARGEYSWKMFGGDWQLSGEAAFNTLDNVSGLFVLAPSGEFTEIPFPEGTGGVKEDRYEALLSFGRKLTDTLSFQLIGGAETSTIAQTGANGLTRSFFRPKGTLSLAWKPSEDFDASLKIRRRVLQLNFYNFLARAFLNDGNANEGNIDLRPQQDWSYEAEFNKKLGPWGSQQFRMIYRDVEDYVDIIPVAGGGEAVGNIAKSWAAAFISTSTIKFDPMGLKGLKLDVTGVIQESGLRDPFTGENRQWSNFATRQLNVALRYDMPQTDWAFGADANYTHFEPRYRSNSVDRTWEGPVFAGVFVENKDVAGLTVRAAVDNILNARSRRYREVYTGLRGVTPISFIEDRDRLIGPIFSVSVRGNF